MSKIDDGISKVIDADATEVAKEYYTDYSKYVLEYRALPSVYDGLKPVQRRIIYTASQYPCKLMKTAKLSGAVMAYHPHGSSSISGAIVEMAAPWNNIPLFNTKGNFGGYGFGAAADRYTECYLSESARFNYCQFLEYADYELGEIGIDEPSSLPCLIPYALYKGSEGIGVGLSTKVMPLNMIDLIDYYIDYIKKDGKTSRLIKPDLGYVMLDMEKEDIKNETSNYKGRLSAYSVVSQISDNTFIIEGLYDRSIDAVINKIDKSTHWFRDEKVGFRDSSKDKLKLVFEIYDSSVKPEEFKEYLVWATRSNKTYTRVMEEDSNAIYTRLEYVIKKSLECLNKAIDKKIATEIVKSKSMLELFEVLKICKDKGVFDNITSKSYDELIFDIVKTSGCTEDVAKEVVKKPITYLTNSHEKEEDSLRDKIKELESHDRKSYLVSLYKEFRKMIMPIYESKKHTMSKSDILENPCVNIDSDGNIFVKDGVGDKFKDKVYFVSDAGIIYPRTISSVGETSVIVGTGEDKIIGYVTDEYNYVKINTKYESTKGYKGEFIVNISDCTYDKSWISFREGESIDTCEGLSKSSYCKNKRGKTNWIKV